MIICTLYMVYTEVTKPVCHHPITLLSLIQHFLSWSGGLSEMTMRKARDKRHWGRQVHPTAMCNMALWLFLLPPPFSLGYMSVSMADLANS